MSSFGNPDFETSHPLQMDPVLEILFNVLEIAEVKNCRFVTQQWATKALHNLQRRTVIKIDTKTKLRKFFTSSTELGGVPPSQRFVGFGFEIHDGWDEVISQHIKSHGAKDLVVYYALDASLRSFDDLQDLISSHAKKLLKFDLTVQTGTALELEYPTCDKGSKVQIHALSVPDSLKQIEYPILNSLTIKHRQVNEEKEESNTELSQLWKAMINKSPNLKELGISMRDPSFWSNLSTSLELRKFETLESLSLPLMTQEISQSIIRIPWWNLKKLEIMFMPGVVEKILKLVAHSLEELKFVTPNESALSPVNFPVIPKLKVLGSGNSQLSFTSIALRQLPVLNEIHVTYWDWVRVTEELEEEDDGDDFYFWRTEGPHPKVTTMVIRFPPLKDITIENYLVWENYVDFCNRIIQKFPSLRSIRLQNMHNNPIDRALLGISKLGEIVRSIGAGLEEITIVDYCKDTVSNCFDLIYAVNEDICFNLKILDLNPTEWLKIWKGDVNDAMEFPYWNFAPISNLRVAKLIWVVNFELTAFVENLPRLVHLEIIGDRCIDRFDRNNMRKLRPDLKYIQHQCLCPKEEPWYFSDPKSHVVFGYLFAEKFAGNESEDVLDTFQY